MNFYKQAYKWMGNGLLPFISFMKKSQKQQIQKFINFYEKVPMIPLKSSLQQTNKNTNKQFVDIDAYQISDAVDPFLSYNETWCDRVNAMKKWSQKKEYLDQMIKSFSVPKLVSKQIHHITNFLKLILNDNNVNVMIQGIKIIGILAQGLRKNFTQQAKIFAPLLIVKLKDKKSNVVDQVHKAFRNLFYCISIEDILQDLKEGLQDKAPSYKIELLILLNKYLQLHCTTMQTNKKYISAYKYLLTNLKKLIDDASVEVRQKCFNLIARMKLCFGQSFFGHFLSDISIQKQQKIFQVYNVLQKSIKQIIQGNNKTKQSYETQKQISNCNKDNFENYFESVGIIKGINNNDWKMKMNALDQIKKIENITQIGHLIITWLKLKLKEWKQLTNINVIKSCISTVTHLCNKKCFINDIIVLFNQFLNESKIQPQLNLLLQKCVEIFSLKEILKQILLAHSKNKNSIQIYKYIVNLIEKYDGQIPKKQLIEYIKILLANPSQKQLGINLYKIIYSRTGSILIQFNHLPNAIFKQLKQISQPYNPQQFINQHSNLTSQINKILPKLSDQNQKIKKEALQQIQMLISAKDTINPTGLTQLFTAIKKGCSDTHKHIARCFVSLAGKLVDIMQHDIKHYYRILCNGLINCLGEKNYAMLKIEAVQVIDKLISILGEQIISQFVPFLTIDNYQLKYQILSILYKRVELFAKSQVKQYIPILLNLCSQNKGQLFIMADKLLKQIQKNMQIDYKHLKKQQNYMQIQQQYNNSLGNKQARLLNEHHNPWPLQTLSDIHINQLILKIKQLPLNCTQKMCSYNCWIIIDCIQQIINWKQLDNYSDLICKWVFWRLWGARKQLTLMLLKLIQKIIVQVGMSISQVEIAILVSAMKNSLGQNDRQICIKISQCCQVFRKNGHIQKILKYWVNQLYELDSINLRNQILQIILSGFIDILKKQLVVIARVPQSHNKQYIQLLLNYYDKNLLKVNGFNFQTQTLQQEQIQNIYKLPQQKIFYLTTMFNKLIKDPSKTNQLIQREIVQSMVTYLITLKKKFIQKKILSIVLQGFILYLSQKHLELNATDIYYVLEALISLLIYNDQRKNEKFYFFIRCFMDLIKIINSLTLKYLQCRSTSPIDVFKALMRILKQNRQKYSYSKTIGLSLKCMQKLVKGKVFDQKLFKQVSQQIFSYIQQINYKQDKKIQNIVVKHLRSIILQLGYNVQKETFKQMLPQTFTSTTQHFKQSLIMLRQIQKNPNPLITLQQKQILQNLKRNQENYWCYVKQLITQGKERIVDFMQGQEKQKFLKTVKQIRQKKQKDNDTGTNKLLQQKLKIIKQKYDELISTRQQRKYIVQNKNHRQQRINKQQSM